MLSVIVCFVHLVRGCVKDELRKDESPKEHLRGGKDFVWDRTNSEMYGMMEERRVVRLVRKIIEEERSEGEEEEDCEGIGDEKAIV